MLSHLRFHRRGQSNPTSPNPEQSSAPAPWDPSLPQKSPFVQDAALSPDARSPAATTHSSLPPTLPPITRVTSDGSESPSPLDRPSVDPKLTLETYAQKQQPVPPPVRSPNNSQSGFVGGVALRKQLDQRQLLQLQKLQQQQQQHEQQLQQQMAALSPDPAAPSPSAFDYGSHETQFSKSKPAPPPPINTAPPTRPPPQPTKSSKHSSSFATPTDLHHHHLSPSQSQPPLQNYAATGRRPTGTRLSSEPTNVRMAKDTAEAPKGRKGLPFLKNPMSTLLMRRKTSQNAPDLSPLPLGGNTLGEPSYDPRIRGTRVHDFSAPRTRRSVLNNDSSSAGAKPQPSIPEEKLDLGKTSSRESAAPSSFHGRNISSASESGRSGSVSVNSQTVAGSNSVTSTKARSSMNLDSKPLPDVPPKDSTASSSRSASVVSKKPSVSAASILSKTLPSTRTGRSRGASLSGQDVLSSVPRHMKSTSSRFSFDMVGAAKAERLLEERHRQRELERKTSDPTPNPNRDSRFDDFDEFDYDAMMDDDGMEEEIPMSNDFDDYEEDFDAGGTDPLGLDGEEDFDAGGTDPLGLDVVPEVEVEMDEEDENDPDNDQENFAGFVFQRSNPASALTSPHSAGLALTPRDADGRVIGFALSKDTPDLNPSLSPGYYPGQSMDSQMSEPADGLAIQGLNVSSKQPQEEQQNEEEQQDAQLVQKPQEAPQNNQWLAPAMPPPPPPPPPKKDDLYFDNGLLDELDFAGEGDGSTFDESIFDLDDTDQYGRPLPGVFAKFQAARAASNATAAQEGADQDPAAQDAAAQEGALQDTSGQEGAAPQSSKRVSDSTSRLSAQSNASASTAHTSLSVGMPAPSTEESKRQSENLGQDESSSAMTSSFSNVEQGKMEAYQAALAAAACEAAANGKFRRDSSPPPSEIMSPGAESSSLPPQDDYPFDDDDDNGFREDLDDYDVDYDDFIAEANASALANDQDGWYGQEFGFYSAPIEGRSHSRDNSTGSDEKPFEYANGGFFGPSGVSRSKSGRMISREPNLTPITERSEYSNRNSIMSLGIPPGIGSGPSSLQSPGLAQLVMMADGEDNMSLTALMKLRSRAWGGSQASLLSSREGSPRSERGDGASSPWGPAPSRDILGIHNGHVRKNSAFSIRSRDMDSDAGSGAGSPTLTMSMPTLSSPTPPMPSLNPASPAVAVNSPHFTHSSSFEPVMESEEVDELSISNSISHSGLWMKSPDTAMHPNLVPRTDPTPPRRPGMGHKHKGSADSISYIKEEDEGETRWVLERRFTAESGEVEVQREVVGKGHI